MNKYKVMLFSIVLIFFSYTVRADIATGLVGDWRFDANGTDMSGRNYNALNNTPINFSGFSLEGNNSYNVTSGGSSWNASDITDFDSGNANITSCGWVKWNDKAKLPDGMVIMSKPSGTGGPSWTWIIWNFTATGGPNNYSWRPAWSGIYMSSCPGINNLDKRAWTFVCFSANHVNTSLYVDGNLCASNGSGTGNWLNTADNLLLGAWRVGSPNNGVNRSVDRTRLWNRSLTVADILEAYWEDARAPFINASSYNATDAYSGNLAWRTSNSTYVFEFSKTPSFRFNMSLPGNCSVGTVDLNYTNMTIRDSNSKCSTTDVNGQTCVLPSTDPLPGGRTCIYFACINSGGVGNNTNVYSTSGCLGIELTLPNPLASLVNASSPVTGQRVGFNATFFTNHNLSHYLFSTNDSGAWVNQTAIPFQLILKNSSLVNTENASVTDYVTNAPQGSDGSFSTWANFSCSTLGTEANWTVRFNATPFNSKYSAINATIGLRTVSNGVTAYSTANFTCFNWSDSTWHLMAVPITNNSLNLVNFTFAFSDVFSPTNGTADCKVIFQSVGLGACTIQQDMGGVAEVNWSTAISNISFQNYTLASTDNAQVGWAMFANDTNNNWNGTLVQSFNMGSLSNSCTCPGSGDYNVQASDNCALTTSCDIRSFHCIGTGSYTIAGGSLWANQTITDSTCLFSVKTGLWVRKGFFG